MTVQRTLTLLPSAARTATSTAEIGGVVSEFDSIDIFLDVTAVSGTNPTMTVTYQASVDGGVTWFDVTSGAAITTAIKQSINVPSKLGAMGRLSYVIGGTTPSFTFSAIAQVRRSGN
jgi:hypothetical protein